MHLQLQFGSGHNYLYSTRHFASTPRCSTSFGQKGFRYQGITWWNALPPDFYQLSSHNAFVQCLQAYLLICELATQLYSQVANICMSQLTLLYMCNTVCVQIACVLYCCVFLLYVAIAICSNVVVICNCSCAEEWLYQPSTGG